MSLYLDGIVDPVAAAGGRELNFIPRHFHIVSLGSSFYDFRSIRNWIWKNQNGRFVISTKSKFEDKRMISNNVVAFEDQGEAIMFSFILPTLNSNLFDDF